MTLILKLFYSLIGLCLFHWFGVCCDWKLNYLTLPLCIVELPFRYIKHICFFTLSTCLLFPLTISHTSGSSFSLLLFFFISVCLYLNFFPFTPFCHLHSVTCHLLNSLPLFQRVRTVSQPFGSNGESMEFPAE